MKKITITIGNNLLQVDENWNTQDGKHYLGWVQRHYHNSFYHGIECGDIIVTDNEGCILRPYGWVKRSITKVVNGTYHGHLKEGVLEWDCPNTGINIQCQGEFYIVDGIVTHEVYRDDKVAYVVKGGMK